MCAHGLLPAPSEEYCLTPADRTDPPRNNPACQFVNSKNLRSNRNLSGEVDSPIVVDVSYAPNRESNCLVFVFLERGLSEKIRENRRSHVEPPVIDRKHRTEQDST